MADKEFKLPSIVEALQLFRLVTPSSFRGLTAEETEGMYDFIYAYVKILIVKEKLFELLNKKKEELYLIISRFASKSFSIVIEGYLIDMYIKIQNLYGNFDELIVTCSKK